MQLTNTRTQVETTRTRILVIDDDPSTLNLVHTVLEVHGYASLTASSAEQALAILSTTPDILIAITDISMPGMDGIVFLERLGSHVPAHAAPGVIFLTAHPRMDFAVAALRLGALDFLTKPVRPQELLQAVKNAVERVQRSRAFQSPGQMSNLAQQAEALAAALKGWAQLQPETDTGSTTPALRKSVANNARDFALLGMEQVRRLRRSFPPLSELDDIAWNLLLDLVRAEKNAQRLSVSALCVSVEHVSSTTAQRRVQELVKAGHIVRVPDPADARRDFVVLDPATQATLDQYLERVCGELSITRPPAVDITRGREIAIESRRERLRCDRLSRLECRRSVQEFDRCGFRRFFGDACCKHINFGIADYSVILSARWLKGRSVRQTRADVPPRLSSAMV